MVKCGPGNYHRSSWWSWWSWLFSTLVGLLVYCVTIVSPCSYRRSRASSWSRATALAGIYRMAHSASLLGLVRFTPEVPSSSHICALIVNSYHCLHLCWSSSGCSSPGGPNLGALHLPRESGVSLVVLSPAEGVVVSVLLPDGSVVGPNSPHWERVLLRVAVSLLGRECPTGQLRRWALDVGDRLRFHIPPGSLEWDILSAHWREAPYYHDELPLRGGLVESLGWPFLSGGVPGGREIDSTKDHHPPGLEALVGNRGLPYVERSRRAYQHCLTYVRSWWSGVNVGTLGKAYTGNVVPETPIGSLELQRYIAGWLWISTFQYAAESACNRLLTVEYGLPYHLVGELTDDPPLQMEVTDLLRARNSKVLTNCQSYHYLSGYYLKSQRVPKIYSGSHRLWVLSLREELASLSDALEMGRIPLTASICY